MVMAYAAVARFKAMFKAPQKSFNPALRPTFFKKLSKHGHLSAFSMFNVASGKEIERDRKVTGFAKQNMSLVQNNRSRENMNIVFMAHFVFPLGSICLLLTPSYTIKHADVNDLQKILIMGDDDPGPRKSMSCSRNQSLFASLSGNHELKKHQRSKVKSIKLNYFQDLFPVFNSNDWSFVMPSIYSLSSTFLALRDLPA